LEQPALLAAYYMIAFLFGGNPLIISWIAGNTAGQTKKSTILAACESSSPDPMALVNIWNLDQAASSAGNIVGALECVEYRPWLTRRNRRKFRTNLIQIC
jgi:hypothetical protein